MYIQFLILSGITLAFSTAASSFYYYRYGKKDISFAIISYSIFILSIVYFVSFENNLGLGIGLLGILSLIRLRSNLENTIDIGFIFYAITIGLINASTKDISIILLADSIMLFVIIILSTKLIFKGDIVQTKIVFDNLESEKLGDKNALFSKIQKEYKITPMAIEINKINYLKDSISITVTYHAKNS